MSIVKPQYVDVDVSTNGSSYYEKLGYKIPRIYDKRHNRYQVKNGTKIKVSVEDLKENSNLIVEVKCDCCGKIEKMEYIEYNRIKQTLSTYNYDYLCLKCKFDVVPTAKLVVGNMRGKEEEIKDFLIEKLKKYIDKNGFPSNKKKAFKPENNLPTLRMYNQYLKGDLVDWIQECGYELSEDQIYDIRSRGGKSVFTKEDCIKEILKIQEVLDRPLIYEDFKHSGVSKIKVATIKKYWGNMNNMKKELGLEILQESMMDKQLSKTEFDSMIEDICNYVKNDNRTFCSSREINQNKNWCTYGTLGRYSEKYYNKNMIQILQEKGIHLGNQGRGICYDFKDGEHTTSQFEYLFSKFLKDYGLVYNKDYFRDVKYSTIDTNYKGNMNCDYKILYNNKTIYIEIAGIISDYKNYYYLNKPITSSKSKETYRKKLKRKSDILEKNNCCYFFLFPCDLTNENFVSVLENPNKQTKNIIDSFNVTNIDWVKVREIGELDYSQDVIRKTR